VAIRKRAERDDRNCYLPTPAEIAAAAAELREAHFAARRAERPEQYYRGKEALRTPPAEFRFSKKRKRAESGRRLRRRTDRGRKNRADNHHGHNR
jgi:hypothetical protein